MPSQSQYIQHQFEFIGPGYIKIFYIRSLLEIVSVLMLNMRKVAACSSWTGPGVKVKGAYSSSWNSPQNYGTPLVNGITQCYLPPDRGDRPAFTPTGPGSARLAHPRPGSASARARHRHMRRVCLSHNRIESKSITLSTPTCRPRLKAILQSLPSLACYLPRIYWQFSKFNMATYRRHLGTLRHVDSTCFLSCVRLPNLVQTYRSRWEPLFVADVRLMTSRELTSGSVFLSWASSPRGHIAF